jgi:putative tricarboxylic transport membrane protein
MAKSSEAWGALFWLVIGAFVARQGWSLDLGQLREPGSGFALFWVGALMVLLATVVMVGALRDPGPALGDLWAGTRWGKVLFVLGLLVAFGFAFEPIGFMPCTLALLLALMLVVDPVPMWKAVPIAALAVGGVWAGLTKGLKIQLPAGVLAPWFG